MKKKYILTIILTLFGVFLFWYISYTLGEVMK